MIIRRSTVHEEVQVIPLVLKEGLKVLDPDSRAGTRHPLPPPAPRRGVISAQERGLKSHAQSVEQRVKMRKRC